MATDDTSKPATVKASPLRLLILTPISDKKTSPSPFPLFLEKLTGTAPSPDVDPFAGYTSHPPLHIKTRYYEANVGLWCDELPPQSTQTAEPSLSEWQEQMLSTSAGEVRDVIGGIVILLPYTSKPQTSEWLPYIEAASELREAIEIESGRDLASAIVLQDMSSQATSTTPSTISSSQTAEKLLDQLEEDCTSHGIIGWDYVLWSPNSNADTTDSNAPDPDTRNAYGEKTGFPRILEVLESVDWTTKPTSLTTDNEVASDIDSLDNDDNILSHPSTTPAVNIITIDNPHSDSSPTKHREPATTSSTNTGDNETATTHLLASSVDNTVSAIANTNVGDHELQRELLGLKMAMLEAQEGHSGASSLAGELDPADFGMRTPLPIGRARLANTTTPGTTTAPAAAGAAASTSTRGEDVGGGLGTGGTPLRRLLDVEGEDEDGNVKDGGGERDEEDQEIQVEQLTGLMERVVAIREAAEGMSGTERERFARREVNKIMRELG